MSTPVPILFDTDLGTDVDDAIALAFLARDPRCDLLGVTTVFGVPDRRACSRRPTPCFAIASCAGWGWARRWSSGLAPTPGQPRS